MNTKGQITTGYKLCAKAQLSKSLPVVPASKVPTVSPVLDDGRNVRWSATILLIFMVLRGESVGEELLVFLNGFRGLTHTARTVGNE